MRLSALLAALPREAFRPQRRPRADVEVSAVTCDSRRVAKGALFVAIPGVDVDGHAFIPQAVRRGATAIVGERELSEVFPSKSPVPYIPVVDSRAVLAHLSAAWNGFPARKMRMIGVTGTDGKTTTVRLIASVLEAAGYRVGLISTVGALIGGEEIDTGFHTTTPDAPAVQQYLARMVQADSQYAVIEATSHGLAQQRVLGCEFDVAVVTNITHEHLDYHGTSEEYRAAKARLFESLRTSYRKPGVTKVSVLNADDSSYDFLEAYAAERSHSYGIECPCDVQATGIRLSPTGTAFTALTPAGDFEVMSPLVGAFSVYNILAAIAVGVSQGLPVEAMQRGIAAMRGVEGRMERMDLGQDFDVIVDFAHTPNALEKALNTARTLTRGKVIVVFGCAGLRDRAKRPLMGKIAGGLADYAYLTAEDPRTEDVNDIIEQIAAGCRQARRKEGAHFWRVPDRGEAIAAAIQKARAGDLVIVTGKGHERSMCYGTTERPWSDHEAVRKALRKRMQRPAKSASRP
jgi:UDP-N-acetylmuramoyl-L-alanyl-D-glutamate--2,6-diaminopimelate ligase